MLRDDMFESKNPYGTCSIQAIESFETLHDFELPKDYRHYLQQYNGAIFRRIYWGNKENPDIGFSIENLYGLHSGPIRNRLDANFKIHEKNDLEPYKEYLVDYVAIGIGGMGEYILLNLESGNICLLTPDFPEPHPPSAIMKHIHFLAKSFNVFACALMTKSEYLDATMTLNEQKVLNERLRQLRKQFEDGD